MKQLTKVCYRKRAIYKRSLYMNASSNSKYDIGHKILLGHYLKGWFVQNIEGNLERRRDKLKLSNKKLGITLFTDWYSPLAIYHLI